jgi:hypothetical protein
MMAKKPKIDETTQYENCLDVKEFEDGTLSAFLGEEAVRDIEEKLWKKHWVGMPEFVQEDNPPYKRIIVSFRTKEDYEEFATMIGQNLSEKTKSIWHPKLDREANSLLRWVEDE